MDLADHWGGPERHNTFQDFSRALPKLARTILSERLQRLVDLGVIETIPVSQTSLYHEYVLTEMGRQLFPVVTAFAPVASTFSNRRSHASAWSIDAPKRQSRRRKCAPLTGKWC
jgi:DNA-binding HxlR family transcriptional regulator